MPPGTEGLLRENREALGFILGPLAGALVLLAVLFVSPGFATGRLVMAAGILLLCVAPGTVLIGLPVYFAIRKVRTPGLWVTAAFGAAISVAPVVVFAALGVGSHDLNLSEQGRLIIYAVIGAGAALCGVIGGLVFWSLVFRTRVTAQGPI